MLFLEWMLMSLNENKGKRRTEKGTLRKVRSISKKKKKKAQSNDSQSFATSTAILCCEWLKRLDRGHVFAQPSNSLLFCLAPSRLPLNHTQSKAYLFLNCTSVFNCVTPHEVFCRKIDLLKQQKVQGAGERCAERLGSKNNQGLTNCWLILTPTPDSEKNILDLDRSVESSPS